MLTGKPEVVGRAAHLVELGVRLLQIAYGSGGWNQTGWRLRRPVVFGARGRAFEVVSVRNIALWVETLRGSDRDMRRFAVRARRLFEDAARPFRRRHVSTTVFSRYACDETVSKHHSVDPSTAHRSVRGARARSPRVVRQPQRSGRAHQRAAERLRVLEESGLGGSQGPLQAWLHLPRVSADGARQVSPAISAYPQRGLHCGARHGGCV